MEAFGIFEGGGAKGLAHVGALRAAENRGIQFVGIAGASAGAIVAALLAAGYKGDELFDVENPSDTSKIYSKAPSDFFKDEWTKIDKFLSEAKDLLKDPGISGTVKFLWNHRDLFKYLFANRGILSTAAIEAHLDRLLCKKIGVSSDRKPVFKEISTPLKIVATDVSRKQLIVFSQEHSPNFPVSAAVAASINLPFVFKPQIIDLKSVMAPSLIWPHDLIQQSGNAVAVDGGLLSNFPAWLFDEERARRGPHTPTLGFRLVEDAANAENPFESKSEFTKFGLNLLGTILSGDPLLETREIENLHEIPLRVTTTTLQFKMPDDRKMKLFNEGYEAANRFFNSPGSPCNPQRMKDGLRKALAQFAQTCELREDRLRINVITPTGRRTLRVTYSYNMDADTDDRLEFPVGSGASGMCWDKKKPIRCDLKQARSSFNSAWKMSKYQQALVKKDLHALLCVPIFTPHVDGGASQRIIGVLNIDSTDDILEKLQTEDAVRLASVIADGIANLMTSSRQGDHDERKA